VTPRDGGDDISILPVRRRHLSVFVLLAPVFVRACVSIGREHARVYVQCQQTDVSLSLSLSLVAPRVHRGSVIRGRGGGGAQRNSSIVHRSENKDAGSRPSRRLYTERSRTSFLRTRNECFSVAVVSARRAFNAPKEKKKASGL